MEVVPAGRMLEQERELALGEPAVAPTQHDDEGAVEIASHIGEKIFVAIGRALVLPAPKYAAGDKTRKTVGQNVRRDLELRQDLVVSSIAEEGFADDHEAPFVADNLQRP